MVIYLAHIYIYIWFHWLLVFHFHDLFKRTIWFYSIFELSPSNVFLCAPTKASRWVFKRDIHQDLIKHYYWQRGWFLLPFGLGGGMLIKRCWWLQRSGRTGLRSPRTAGELYDGTLNLQQQQQVDPAEQAELKFLRKDGSSTCDVTNGGWSCTQTGTGWWRQTNQSIIFPRWTLCQPRQLR